MTQQYCVQFWAFQHILEQGWAEARESEEDGAPEEDEQQQQFLFILEIKGNSSPICRGIAEKMEQNFP